MSNPHLAILLVLQLYMTGWFLLALWINFGTLVNGSLSWLKGRYWFGAFLGALGGPADHVIREQPGIG